MKNTILLFFFGFYFWNLSFENRKESLDPYQCTYRYYDSKHGRFCQVDSVIPDIKKGWNRYASFYNNPIKYNDPDGHVPQDPSQEKIQVIPYISSEDPSSRHYVSPIDDINNLIGQYDRSRGFIKSDIAVASSISAKQLIDQMQSLLGDQGTIFGMLAWDMKLSFLINDELTDSFDFYMLGMQVSKNPRPGSYSHKLSKELQDLFDLTTRNKTQGDSYPSIGIRVNDGLAQEGGGGQTYENLTLDGISSSAIFLDANSQYLHPAHLGPPFKLPLGVAAFHELFVHAGNLLKKQQVSDAHNTLKDDLLGKYDDGHKEDNTLIFRAYNENHPNSPLPDRAHYRHPLAPQARQVLDSTIFRPFRVFQKKEK